MKYVFQILTLIVFFILVFLLAVFIKIEFFDVVPVNEKMAVANIPLHHTRSQARYLSFKKQFMRSEEVDAKISIIFIKTASDKSLAERAFNDLPPEVAFAFSPYEQYEMTSLMRAARNKNHNILLDIPMETIDYPITNSGIKAILNNASEEDNLSYLTSFLETKNMPTIKAVTSSTGSGISELDVVASVIAELEERNMIFIDQFGRMSKLEDGSESIKKSDFFIQKSQNIEKKLELAKQKALSKKHVIITIPLTENSLSITKNWIKKLNQKEVKLARL